MKIKLTLKFTITFLALTFVMQEAHEIVHTTVGRILCGCWGKRDFNVWELCSSCDKNPLKYISTFAGPLFTFIMIWLGYSYLGKTKTTHQKSFGFALIFANMPFARLLNPMLGGGDEVVVLMTFFDNYKLSRIIIFTLITLIVFIPLRQCFLTIENKNRLAWFFLFFIAPVALDLIIVLGLMNTLLNKKILSNNWILGSPILVTLWTALVVLLFFSTRKNIYSLGKSKTAINKKTNI